MRNVLGLADPPPGDGARERVHGLAGEEDPAHVGLHDAVPLLGGHLEHRRVRIDPGVGHRHRDGAEGPFRAFEELRRRPRVAYVYRARVDPRGAADLLRASRQRRLAHVAEGNAPPRVVEGLGDAEPDAGSRSRHQHYIVREVEHTPEYTQAQDEAAATFITLP